MLLRTQVLHTDAEDAVASGRLTRNVAEAAVRLVHEAADRGLAFVAITVFGFVAGKATSSTEAASVRVPRR